MRGLHGAGVHGVRRAGSRARTGPLVVLLLVVVLLIVAAAYAVVLFFVAVTSGGTAGGGDGESLRVEMRHANTFVETQQDSRQQAGLTLAGKVDTEATT